jgi:hypothetical protein
MIPIDTSKIVTADEKAATRRKERFAALAKLRWEHETGGLVLPNGVFVRTDRETRASIIEGLRNFSDGLVSEPVNWKLTSGWIKLSEAELRAISAAVAGHVTASFSAEEAVSKQLTAGADMTDEELKAAFDAAYAAEVSGNGQQ